MSQILVQSIYFSERGEKIIPIYGRDSKGIPGIEILGPVKETRILKEKFLFLLKEKKLSLPLRRYILCPDYDEGPVGAREFRQWEWPLFYLLLSLGGLARPYRLDQSVMWGTLSAKGGLTQQWPQEILLNAPSELTFFISTQEHHSLENIRVISLEKFLKDQLSFPLLNREFVGQIHTHEVCETFT